MADERAKKVSEEATEAVRRTWRDPKVDISREREVSTVDSGALACVLAGGEESLKRRGVLSRLLQAEPWANKADRYFLSREELHKRGLQVAIGIRELVEKHGLSYDDALTMRKLVDLPGGFELHFGMWMPTLLNQGTEEQLEKWMGPSIGMEILGTYAQTELGHGTFLKGLETTASFDEERDEFIVNSPTNTATKWWPGGLGKTATHAVVMCRLFIKGRDYGPHPFVVQLRDLETHLPLPGRTIGDIGPKMGYNGVDNGFLSFDHVRIPRGALLQRYTKVTREGSYVPPPKQNAKSSYATMVSVRADIVEYAGEVLSKAVTIAVRYNAVRRQTTSVPGQPEEIILNYQQSARNLISQIAISYALLFMGRSMHQMHESFEADRESGDFGLLPELHATSSCLKALCTWLTTSGIEICRQSCGGQGYSVLSGLPGLYTNYVQNLTWEGDNTILCLQTARYLTKTLMSILQAHKRGDSQPALAETVAYLAGTVQEDPFLDLSRQDLELHDLFSFEVLDSLMSQRSLFVAKQALENLEANARRMEVRVQLGEGLAWNASHVSLVKLAKCHGWLLLHRSFFGQVAALEKDAKLPDSSVKVLRDVAFLFTLCHVEDSLGDFLEGNILLPSQASVIHEAVQELLRKLRTEAVALVDAFSHDDYSLNSAIGSRDGDVYNRLLRMARSSPFNATQEGPAWDAILNPFFNRGKRTAKL
ncbi:acyl-coenzyme A oxidase [Chloropicon primus]|uniref:Acyl-coenzyme A oxidase n=2 Tax=Chloropicon primus TaxID=1764295 RepID=A0A5B8N0L7_9CHLO|nr:acyl-coenzyme A oxidase [Chloropicon primus]UPR04769.1 acyl-coenzyme A oxidase [Chloropicon primus]|eukprot:QDZ25572.1 acyl-coenzyme A oxidase [Chloropicon primus]